jgi:hypothetical protein
MRSPIANLAALNAAGISPPAVVSLFPLLDTAAALADAEAAVLSNSGQGFHSLLLAVRLSRGMMKVVVRQMERWVIRTDIPTTHIVSFKHSAPLFVISTPLPLPARTSMIVMSLLTTGESLPANCSLDKIEGIAVGMASLLTIHEESAPRMAWVGLKNSAQPLCCCCMCSGIENEHGDWQAWQIYLEEKIGRDLSHTYCPTCLAEHFPEVKEMVA